MRLCINFSNQHRFGVVFFCHLLMTISFTSRLYHCISVLFRINKHTGLAWTLNSLVLASKSVSQLVKIHCICQQCLFQITYFHLYSCENFPLGKIIFIQCFISSKIFPFLHFNVNFLPQRDLTDISPTQRVKYLVKTWMLIFNLQF